MLTYVIWLGPRISNVVILFKEKKNSRLKMNIKIILYRAEFEQEFADWQNTPIYEQNLSKPR